MTQLNQIVAIEKGVKSRAQQDFTQAHRLLETKTAQLNGLARTYQPVADDGEKFPPESTRVQINVPMILNDVKEKLTRLFDVTLTKDVSNCKARADILIDGAVLAPQVPVTYLLFLEKELTDIHTFVSKLPVLDQAETWSYDENVDAYATPPTKTVKTKKIPRNHVKWTPPDPSFTQPAQVEIFTEDVVVGYWTSVKYSGALRRSEVVGMQSRVIKLMEAVKKAREIANTLTVTDQTIGGVIFDYVFGTTIT
jgi:hypothetical protein